MSLPEKKIVKVTTLYNEELNGLIIPLSVKANMMLESETDKVKEIQHNERKHKIEMLIDKFTSESEDIDIIKSQYVESKIISDLSKSGESFDEARVESQKKKRTDILLKDKTIEEMIKSLATIQVEVQERSTLTNKVVTAALWNTLRKADNPREKLFSSIDELEESLSFEIIMKLFGENVDESKNMDAEELKN